MTKALPNPRYLLQRFLKAQNYGPALSNLSLAAKQISRLPLENQILELNAEIAKTSTLRNLDHFIHDVRRLTKGTDYEHPFNEELSVIEQAVIQVKGKTEDKYLAFVEKIEQEAKEFVQKHEAEE